MINVALKYFKRKIRDVFKETLSKSDRKDINGKPFVIISDDCWGAEIYQWYGRPYNTPFVGLFIFGPCYYKLLSNFDFYMSQKLEFIEKSKYASPRWDDVVYPIGKLADIEIHFLHYENKEIALEKWERRTERMLTETDKNNYFFKISDRERNDEFIEDFHKLPYKNKISYSLKDYKSLKNVNHIKINEKSKKGNYVVNGKKLYKLSFLYFDLHKWLKN